MPSHFLIKVSDGISPERIRRAMDTEGLEILELRETMPNCMGYIFTKSLAGHVWDTETGADRCTIDGCNHRTREYLSEEQQDAFALSLARFLENCVREDFMPEIALENHPLFTETGLTRCGEE